MISSPMNCKKNSVGITKCSQIGFPQTQILCKKLGLRFGHLFFFHCIIAFDLLHPEVGNAVFSEYKLLLHGSCSIYSSSSSESDKNSCRLFAGTSSSEESSVGESLLSDGRLSYNPKTS
ncbi:hypothetical protein TNCV_614911 [Trichonephila clavipes]|nr:hypothetical protein TNCV_614911 [Trichonephila clavipes]